MTGIINDMLAKLKNKKLRFSNECIYRPFDKTEPPIQVGLTRNAASKVTFKDPSGGRKRLRKSPAPKRTSASKIKVIKKP